MATDSSTNEKEEYCGIVMPISAIDECGSDHWVDVKQILSESIENAGLKARVVSEANDSWIIQKRIIQNLYEDPIVIVDVSWKNPNVMFELGLRLAFDKPTIVVKDDKTNYSFDTAPIEHLGYPRGLRYQDVLQFKTKLTEKITWTLQESRSNTNYSTFLKHFWTFTVAKIDEKEVGKEEFLLRSMEDLRQEFRQLSRKVRNNNHSETQFIDKDLARAIVQEKINKFLEIKKLSFEFELSSPELKEECFKYLEEFSDVKRICESPRMLKKIIDEIVDIPF